MNETITLMKKLVAMKTENRENANRAAEYVHRLLLRQSIHSVLLTNQGHKMVYARIGRGEKTLVLCGHLDVVPGKPEQYEVRESDGRLWGRGVYDMLGACAVMITLLMELSRKKLNCNVELMLSTTEETNAPVCIRHILAQGYRSGSFAICGEPTNLKVSMMSKGVLRINAGVKGISAHSSRPWLGDNAILKAVDYYNRICHLPFASRSNQYFDSASVSLSVLEGGKVGNQVPDEARMTVDIRYIPGEDPEQLLSEIKQACPDMEVISYMTASAVQVMEEDPMVAKLIAAVQKYAPADPVKMAQHGTADTAFFQEAGIPSVEFGMTGGGHHGDHEYLEIASIAPFKNILTELVRVLAL